MGIKRVRSDDCLATTAIKRQRSNPIDFLSLPGEVRTVVYEKFFEDSFILRLSTTNSSGKDILKYRLQQPTNINFLATCKQVYREAHQICIDSTTRMKTLMPLEWHVDQWGDEVPEKAMKYGGSIIKKILQGLQTIHATHHCSLNHLGSYSKLQKVTLHQILPTQVVGFAPLSGVDMNLVYSDPEIQARFIRVFVSNNTWVQLLLEKPAPTPAGTPVRAILPAAPLPTQTHPVTTTTTQSTQTPIPLPPPPPPPSFLTSAPPTTKFEISFLLHSKFPRYKPCEPGCNCTRPVQFLDIRAFGARTVTVDALENKVVDRANLARPEFLREMRRWGMMCYDAGYTCTKWF